LIPCFFQLWGEPTWTMCAVHKIVNVKYTWVNTDMSCVNIKHLGLIVAQTFSRQV